MEDLRSDLLDWNWLYVAGRLHKPVVNLITPPADQSGLNLALLENRKCALHAALLQLPDTFSFEQLFQTIVGISYNGDFRMRFAEDRQKISKVSDYTINIFILLLNVCVFLTTYFFVVLFYYTLSGIHSTISKF